MELDFLHALDEITTAKGISKDVIFEALEAALISSYKKHYGTSQNAIIDIDQKLGEIRVFAELEVVDDVIDDNVEISLENARDIDSIYQVGDIVRKEITPAKFGRIAAQTAKQVVIQRIKDAERDVIYDQYIDREKEIINGQIQRVNNGIAYIDLGRTEAILPVSEQIPGVKYKPGDIMRLFVLSVKKTNRGPEIILSRRSPSLITRLFELEVPEIQDGIVEIYSIAREAGSRSKIAVYSKNEDVDPLGACVGFKGSRVQAIVDELDNENIDIVLWDKRIKHFIANALSPSDVIEVVVNEKERSTMVIVPDNQLSLAIGKEGQNARLAAKLTNWKIDIKSESQFDEYYDSLSDEEQDELNDLMNSPEVYEDIHSDKKTSINIEDGKVEDSLEDLENSSKDGQELDSDELDFVQDDLDINELKDETGELEE